MFSLLVSRHFAKRCEMDPSLPTYVLPILSSSSSIDLRPYTEGRPEWTLGRARVTTPCAASDRTERREIEKSFLASNPMSCNIDGVHGRRGGTIVILAGHDEMKGLEREGGVLLGAMSAIHAEKALLHSNKKGDTQSSIKQ